MSYPYQFVVFMHLFLFPFPANPFSLLCSHPTVLTLSLYWPFMNTGYSVLSETSKSLTEPAAGLKHRSGFSLCHAILSFSHLVFLPKALEIYSTEHLSGGHSGHPATESSGPFQSF